MIDRIERHDVANAIMLAAVLLLLGFGMITAFRSLASSVGDGLVIAEKDPTLESEQAPAGATSSTVEGTTTTETTLIETRPPEEVMVRVANGARRAGVAGAGTDRLSLEGYDTLPPKNGPTMDDSIVYYLSGYAADAVRVAELLGLESTQIEPMPSDPGVPLDGAHLLAILGVSSEF